MLHLVFLPKRFHPKVVSNLGLGLEYVWYERRHLDVHQPNDELSDEGSIHPRGNCNSTGFRSRWQ